eukprot:5513329-Lingulodinium_polyedra.AAC.1
MRSRESHLQFRRPRLCKPGQRPHGTPRPCRRDYHWLDIPHNLRTRKGRGRDVVHGWLCEN